MKDLVVRESYVKDQREKVSWDKIEVLFEANGKQYIKLFHMPGVLISVFEQKQKDTTSSKPEDWLPPEG